jgi:hypothetical protein
MSKIKIYLLSLLMFILFTKVSFCQIIFNENNYNKFVLKSNVIIQTNEFLKPNINSKSFIFPYCYYEKDCDFTSIKIDTTKIFLLLETENKIYQCKLILEDSKWYIKNIDLLTDTIYYNNIIELYKKFNYVTLLEFDEKEINKYIGVLQNGNYNFYIYKYSNVISILEYSIKESDTLNISCNDWFWSLQKYFEINGIKESERFIYQNMTVEKAKEILKNSYSYRYIFNPKDTLLCIDLLLNELETLVPISLNQKNHIKISIIDEIKKSQRKDKCKEKICSNSIYIGEVNINFSLNFYLTTNQYNIFMLNRKENEYVEKMAYDKIYNTLKTNNNADNIDNLIYQYILK